VHDQPVVMVQRCPPTVRDRALATVVSAFADDPVFRWVWPAKERYDELAPPFLGILLDSRIAGGEVWTADSGAAVAMWEPPGGLYLPAPEGSWARLKDRMTEREIAAWAVFGDAMGVPSSAGPHWYLGVLATEPARQGTGLGRAVSAPMLGAADRAGTPAYLETATPGNLGIYRRLGFEVAREVDVPEGGPRSWLMRRDPRRT
jgi:GNAT superfamily N-acetyltransferase